jgi:hypothetical protein
LGQEKENNHIILKKRKCMVKMATENEFAGLKLYAFFHLKAVDEEPKLFADRLLELQFAAAAVANTSSAEDLARHRLLAMARNGMETDVAKLLLACFFPSFP